MAVPIAAIFKPIANQGGRPLRVRVLASKPARRGKPAMEELANTRGIQKP